ncbi:MAG: hypothetical protein R6W72_07730 [Desulfurivibrionaceae bacterium]
MSTNRRRRKRNRSKEAVPDWVRTYLETGKEPNENEDPEAHGQLIGWLYFDEKVSGLGDPKDYWKKEVGSPIGGPAIADIRENKKEE